MRNLGSKHIPIVIGIFVAAMGVVADKVAAEGDPEVKVFASTVNAAHDYSAWSRTPVYLEFSK